MSATPPASDAPGAGDLAARVDAAGTVTCYFYDPLHRLRQTTYPGGGATASFGYDEATHSLGGSLVTLANPIGNRTSATLGGVDEVFSFDTMGRVVNNDQYVPASGMPRLAMNYLWDLAGDLVEQPLGLVNGLGNQIGLGISYNAAQRPVSLGGYNYSGIPSLTGAHYNGFGAPVGMTWGNGAGETRCYDSRGRLSYSGTRNVGAAGCGTTLSDPHMVYALALGYEPDGDVASVADNVSGDLIQYGFDAQNRLQSSACSGNCPGTGTATAQAAVNLSWSFDRYGNRWAQAAGSGQTAPHPSASFTAGDNHVDGWTYYATGEVYNDGSHTYGFDAEHRMSSADTTIFTYNADGERVGKQTPGGVSIWYALDLAGRPVGNFDGGDWEGSEIYLGARHVGYYDHDADTGSNPQAGTYTVADHLGSERMRLDRNANAYESCASLAYGDAQHCSGTPDASPNHFTGQARDPETAIDFFNARYFTSLQGRFLQPDPGWSLAADPANPQSWNQYAYALGDPASNVDPTGLHVECVSTKIRFGTCIEVPDPLPPGPPSRRPGGGGNGGGGDGGGGGGGGATRACGTTGFGGGILVSYGGSADAGIALAGISGSGAGGGGLFYGSSDGFSAGLFASGGAAAYALNHYVGAPSQTGQPASVGAYAGAGPAVTMTNARSIRQLGGPFTSATLNVGFGPVKFSVQFSFANGIYELTVAPPVPLASAGIGASLSKVTHIQLRRKLAVETKAMTNPIANMQLFYFFACGFVLFTAIAIKPNKIIGILSLGRKPTSRTIVFDRICAAVCSIGAGACLLMYILKSCL